MARSNKTQVAQAVSAAVAAPPVPQSNPNKSDADAAVIANLTAKYHASLSDAIGSMVNARLGVGKADADAFSAFYQLLEDGLSRKEADAVFTAEFVELRAKRAAKTIKPEELSALRTGEQYAASIRDAIELREAGANKESPVKPSAWKRTKAETVTKYRDRIRAEMKAERDRLQTVKKGAGAQNAAPKAKPVKQPPVPVAGQPILASFIAAEAHAKAGKEQADPFTVAMAKIERAMRACPEEMVAQLADSIVEEIDTRVGAMLAEVALTEAAPANQRAA